jgi:hypothetical protein
MAVKKRVGRPRKKSTTTATAKKTGKRGRPKGSKNKAKVSATVTATAKPKRGRPRKKVTATATATAKPRRKTARKLSVGDCGGKLTRSRLVGGYGLKKRIRKPKMKTVRRRK